MKKLKITLSVLLLCCVFSTLAYQAFGATDPTYNNWITKKGNFWVRKIVFSAVSDSETATFAYDGHVTRIVVDVTGTDADGDIAISDTSGANYVNWTNKLGSGDIDYVVNINDADGNTYGGPPTSGTHTVTLTDCGDLTAATLYIYCNKD